MQVLYADKKIQRFIKSLEKSTIAKLLRTVNILEQFGYEIGMPYSKKVDHDLFELRVRGQQEIRILYAFHQGSIFLLHGFIKKSNRIPPKELLIAKQKLDILDKA